MNERLLDICIKANINTWPFNEVGFISLDESELVKFAELIVRECTAALFDESERLFGLYSEEADMQQAERYELCSEQCTDNIALIEKHFGVEE